MEAGIRCMPDISLEYQRAANRHVLRGRESGGAVNELGTMSASAAQKGRRFNGSSSLIP